MSTDDTMRRIEEALDLYGSACFMEVGDGTVECVERTMQRRSALLATIRAALDAQPSPTSGESPAVSAEVAQKDAGGWGEDDDRHRANEEAELLKPHEFTGRHRSYQELLDAEHERAVEKLLEAVDSCEIRALQTVSGFQVYFLPEHVLDEALRLMRRQPKTKETT